MDRDVAAALGVGKRTTLRRWAKRAGWFALLIVLASIAWRWWRGRGPGPPTYETTAIVRGDLEVAVSATGTVEPTNLVDVGPEISGLVREVLVDFNDRVVKGQVLATLDTEIYEAQVRQAEARLAVGRATLADRGAALAEARRQGERSEALFRRGVIAEADRDGAETALARAEAARSLALAELRAARAALTLAKTNLDRAVIRSPIDGVVLSRTVEVGQAVVAALQAPVLFRLAESLDKMQVFVDIDEADIGAVEAGQLATFSVSAYLDRDFRAVVAEVRNSPVLEAKVVTYTAVLEVDNSDLVLKPGMTATARIITSSHEDVVMVANAALRFDPRAKGGAPSRDPRTAGDRLWTLNSAGEPIATPVIAGASNGEFTMLRDASLPVGTEVLTNVK